MIETKQLLEKEFGDNITFNIKENTVYYKNTLFFEAILDFIRYNKLKVNVQLSLL